MERLPTCWTGKKVLIKESEELLQYLPTLIMELNKNYFNSIFNINTKKTKPENISVLRKLKKKLNCECKGKEINR